MHFLWQLSPGIPPGKLVANPANKIKFKVDKYEVHVHKTEEYSFNTFYALDHQNNFTNNRLWSCEQVL